MRECYRNTPADMDNAAPADELLTHILASKQARNDLEDVLLSLRTTQHMSNPPLSAFHDQDAIRDTITVLHGANQSVDYLVYQNGHERAGEEVRFDVAGYLASFSLPCHGLSQRYARLLTVDKTTNIVIG